MKSAYIGPGDRLTISAATDDGPKRIYTSYVDAVLDDNLLLVYAPIFKGQIIRLFPSDGYEFLFYAQTGLYRSIGSIVDCFVQNNVFLMKIQVSQLEHIQRRDSYRVDAAFQFNYTKDSEEENLEETPPIYTGKVQNISAGGMRFETDLLLQEGERINCRLTLHDLFITVQAKILNRDQPAEDIETPEAYTYRGQFIHLDNRLREKIIQFVFRQQREIILRKKRQISGPEIASK
ncbi:flagellar brake protein [Clostridium minihomine]|uniref:flagellar brake protein n=1 Tax=Clostridium minihomine TaxID=2045012 RepID=UPI000C760F3C|nr:flagellar brake protein [Clostridium minihomine]